MSILHQSLKQLSGPDALNHLRAALHQATGMDKIKVVFFDSLHKLVCYGHRDIEVIEFACIALAIDKLLNVRMIDPEHAHIGTTPGTTLANGFSSSIIDHHKTNRS